MNASPTDDDSDENQLDEFASRVQERLAPCATCQPYDKGEAVWLNPHTDLDDLMEMVGVPEACREEVAERLDCPCCHLSHKIHEEVGYKADAEATQPEPLSINYVADGFPKPFADVNGTSALKVSWAFLVWSAISVGRAELIHIVQYGEYSLLEIVYRAAMIFANLREDEAGQIRRSEAYDGLDPSEKGAISYFLGLTMAKAFAEKKLSVPWLMHLDVYRKELKPTSAGKSRPDLVGQTRKGQWVGIEAKGRSNAFETNALNNAKAQAQMLGKVKGEEPVLRIGMVTHFGDERLQFSASDPQRDKRRHRVDLPLERERLMEGYYRPFRRFLSGSDETREISGEKFRIAYAANADLSVGLAEPRMESNAPGVADAEHSGAGESSYVGRDGVLVILGPLWSPSNMALEPQSRTRP